MLRWRLLTLGLVFLIPGVVQGGLYYSGEPLADLPSQWRGFLLDQRALRGIGIPATAATPASPLRLQYQEEAAKLEKLRKTRSLTADELADLGAIYVRLKELDRAIDLLRQAQRQHPNHFRIVANLGTAWQLRGDLRQASLCLQQAVKLAPGKWQQAEEYHLKLVLLRLHEPPGSQGLDDLFGVLYGSDKGAYEPGKLAAAEKKKLPAQALAIMQQLCLWLPADGRLLWQLAELASAHGDVRIAASMMDGCIIQFGMAHPDLRRRRQLTRAAADALPKETIGSKTDHESHVGGIPARSRRPLLTRVNQAALPPISATGVNPLPWALLNETTIQRPFRPEFPQYLKELNGKQVSLTGFMQPLGESLDQAAFLFIEFPVGCWYCEMPELAGIIFVEMPRGQTAAYSRGLVRVTGRLVLNFNDPEEFLYSIRNARVGEVD